MKRLDDHTVELTPQELLVSEIHANLMDRGLDQGTALIYINGGEIPSGLRHPTPELDKVLSDLEFVLHLIA